jgi:hypothetical protein
MAGSLGGRSWRVRKLEGLYRGRERPEPSRTQMEASAIDAEIMKVNEEMRALGVDPEKLPPVEFPPGLSLDEQIAELEKEIAALEKELGYDDDH